MASTTLLDLILLGPRSSSKTDFASIETLIQKEFSQHISLYAAQSQDEIIRFITSQKRPSIIVTTLNPNDERTDNLLRTVLQETTMTFFVLYSSQACAEPSLRWHFASSGVNMITDSIVALRSTFTSIISATPVNKKGPYTCPYCQWGSLSFEQLYIHVPLYHTNSSEQSGKCELCRRTTNNIGVHLHEEHSPVENHQSQAAPLYAFALVVCRRRRDQRFLVVQEAGSMGFWLPGGRVEVAERLEHAAVRETLEEAGVNVRLMGVLKFEFTPKTGHNRLRIIFYAEPMNEDDCEPKTIPDYESYGALWVTYEQIVQANLDGQLRGGEPLHWFKYLTQNGQIYPMSILS